MPTFYALIIGINEYQHDRILHLQGCVNDAEGFANYLHTYIDKTKYKLAVQKLYSHSEYPDNQKPTRVRILQTLQSYIGNVKQGDVFCLFYAGHGSYEQAHAYFQSPTGWLSSIVPCDSGMLDANQRPVYDILSVELRHILRQIWNNGQPEIIFIQDSCHSERATRDYSAWKNAEQYAKRMVEASQHPNFNKPRQASEYSAFDTNIQTAIARATPTTGQAQTPTTSQLPFAQASPEAPHIHLAACAFDESAHEDNTGSVPHGIFSKTLLELLAQTNGKISYNDLEKRLRLNIEKKFPQTPNLYVRSDDPTKRFTQFLGSNVLREDYIYNVVVTQNPETAQVDWTLDVGAIQGLPILKNDEKIAIELLDWDLNLISKAHIDYVLPTTSLLKPEQPNLPTDKLYKARIDASALVRVERKLNVYIEPEKSIGATVWDRIFNEICTNLSDDVQQSAQPAYTLSLLENQLHLYKLKDDKTEQLVCKTAIVAQPTSEPAPAVWAMSRNTWERYDEQDNLRLCDATWSVQPATAELWDLLVYGIVMYLQRTEKQFPVPIAKSQILHFDTFRTSAPCQPLQTWIQWTATEAQAEYIIRSHDQQFALTLPQSEMPIAEPLRPSSALAAAQLCDYLQRMAQFKQRRFLYNPHPLRVQSFADIKLTLFFIDKNNSNKRYTIELKSDAPNYGKLPLTFLPNATGLLGMSNVDIQLSYQSESNEPLYVAILAMEFDQTIRPLVDVTPLQPTSQPPTLVNGVAQPLTMETHLKTYPAAFRQGYFKILVGFTQFDIAPLLQAGLPRPRVKTPDVVDANLRTHRTRGNKAADWNAFTIPFEYNFL